MRSNNRPQRSQALSAVIRILEPLFQIRDATKGISNNKLDRQSHKYGDSERGGGDVLYFKATHRKMDTAARRAYKNYHCIW